MTQKYVNSDPVKVVHTKGKLEEGQKYVNSLPWKVELTNDDLAYQEDIQRLQQEILALEADLTWRDPVATVEDLPQAGNEEGDVRLVEDIGILYVWDGDEWIALNESNAKLYDSTGQNTDGAMTQKATTDALDNKLDKSTTFWGASYDATNNEVAGELNIGTDTLSQFSIFRRPKTSTSTYWRNIRFLSNAYNIDVRDDLGDYLFTIPSSKNSTAMLTSELRMSRYTDGTDRKRITCLGDPTNATDAVNKQYVDTAVASAGATAFPTSTFNAILEEA